MALVWKLLETATGYIAQKTTKVAGQAPKRKLIRYCFSLLEDIPAGIRWDPWFGED